MRKTTHQFAKRRTSIFVTLFRKSKKQSQLPTPTAFGNLHEGTIIFRKTTDNVYMAMFQSLKNNRRAHAWGSSFHSAYANMIGKFNDKYAV